MAVNSYEVIDGPVTIHRDVRQLRNPLTNEPVGYQRGAGKTYHEGDVLEEAEVSSLYRDALDDKGHELHEAVSRKLKKVSDEPGLNLEAHLGLPFEGYDDMETEDIVNAMRVLPSATVSRIKQYENANEGRSEITNYNVGFGEHPDARQNAQLDVPDPAEDKAAREITTREVPNTGPVRHGEGITGTGEPAVEPGTAKAEEDEEENKSSGSKSRAPKARAGRRARTPKSGAKAANAKSGSNSDDNDDK